MRKVWLLLAEGSEEIEVVVPADLLRRAGIQVELVGIAGEGLYRCSRGVTIKADVSLKSLDDETPDVLLLPGGAEGAAAFQASKALGRRLKAHEASGALTAVLCASPIALKAHGVFEGCRMTAHPSVHETIRDYARLVPGAPVVIDGSLITGAGPGAVFPFSLALIEMIQGKDVREAVEAPLMLP